MAAALAFVPVLAAQADDIGGEEIIVPTIVEETVVIVEKPVSLPPPGMTREQTAETDGADSE
jgi:hypothetical protein